MAEYELLELVDLGEGELGDVSFYFLVEYLRAEELVVGHGEIGDHFLDEGGCTLAMIQTWGVSMRLRR